MKAADQNHADAQCRLGQCYQFGRGVEINVHRAIQWYNRAAGQGNLDAMYNLGLEKEIFGSRDDARIIYTKAADKGHLHAKCRLIALEQYPDQRQFLLKSIIAQHQTHALCEVAMQYEFTTITIHDRRLIEAAKLLRQLYSDSIRNIQLKILF